MGLLSRGLVGTTVVGLFVLDTSGMSQTESRASSAPNVGNAGDALVVSREIQLEREMSIGKPDDSESESMFGRIAGATVIPDGDIYVLDDGFRKIYRFSIAGESLGSFGREGQGPGEFAFPLAIASDAEGIIYVADLGRILVFDQEGNPIETFRHGLTGSPIRSISVDGQGNIYVSSLDVFNQNVVHKFDTDRKLVNSFCKSFAVGTDTDVRLEQFVAGGHLEIVGSNLYYSQLYPYEIRVFSLEGNLEARIQRPNDFMEPPIFEQSNGQRKMGLPSSSARVRRLPNLGILNSVICTGAGEGNERAVLDLFHKDGTLVASMTRAERWILEAIDEQGRIYASIRGDVPSIERYRVHLNVRDRHN